jgi:3-oxoacyl-[acyl-carrier-protein] synthase II
MQRRVVITGMGTVNPLGLTVEETWKNVLAGRSGIAPTRIFDAETFPTSFSAQVPEEFDVADYVRDPAEFELAGRNVLFAMAAGKTALDDSGLTPDDYDATRFGVYLGSGEGVLDFLTTVNCLLFAMEEHGSVDPGKFADRAMDRFEALRELEVEPHLPMTHLACEHGLQGPAHSCLTACAASTQAIGEAREIVRTGRADLMLAGGTHSMIHPLGVTGFNLLTAISTEPKDDPTKASRPFDRNRAGFVLGEGSTVMVLEDLEHAQARGARIWAEIIGYGSSADAYRMTDIHPEGRGPAAAIRAAIQDASVSPESIHYISAHGTGTQENDRVETLAVKKVFGDHAWKVPVSSVKSMMGHLIAAAGATELMTCVLAIRDQIVPPTINLETPDPECDLDYVPGEAREQEVEVCLSNSFGFGGQNDSLVVRRFEP